MERQPDDARVNSVPFLWGVGCGGWELGTLLGPEESGGAHPDRVFRDWVGVLWCRGFFAGAGSPHTGRGFYLDAGGGCGLVSGRCLRTV